MNYTAGQQDTLLDYRIHCWTTGYTAGQQDTRLDYMIHSWTTGMDTLQQQQPLNSRNRCQTYSSRTRAKVLLWFTFTATTGTEPVQLLPWFTRGYSRTGARPVGHDESLELSGTPLQVAQATGCGSGIHHIGLEDPTREGAKQGLLSLLMAFSSSGERRGVPEGCCCWKQRRSGRSGRCNRSSLIELSPGGVLLICPQSDDVTEVHKMADCSHKMAAPSFLVPRSRSVGAS